MQTGHRPYWFDPGDASEDVMFGLSAAANKTERRKDQPKRERTKPRRNPRSKS